MTGRFTDPRLIGVGMLLITVLLVGTMVLGAIGLVHQRQTDRQVQRLATKVFLIQQPTKEQRKAGLTRAVTELNPEQARTLLGSLIKAASPAQRKQLRDIANAQRKRDARKKRREPSKPSPAPGGSAPSSPAPGGSGGTTSAPAPSRPSAPSAPPTSTRRPGVPSVTVPPVKTPPVGPVPPVETPPVQTPSVPLPTPQIPPLPQPCNVPVVGKPC